MFYQYPERLGGGIAVKPEPHICDIVGGSVRFKLIKDSQKYQFVGMDHLLNIQQVNYNETKDFAFFISEGSYNS